VSVPRLDFQSHISVFMFNDLRFHVCFLDTLFSYVSHSILSFVIVGLHHILLVVNFVIFTSKVFSAVTRKSLSKYLMNIIELVCFNP
jgi:hypothetical protein